MNIVVIDDSIDEARQLVGFIPTYCPGTRTCQQTIIPNTAASFPHHQQRGSFDLIFIDIFLRSKASGIQTAERVRRNDDLCTIVFATSNTDFVLKGYEVRAPDYMIEPIRYEKLCQAVEYFISVSHRKQSHHIEIKENRIMFKIPIGSIFYTNYSSYYTQIHLPDKTVRTHMRFEGFSDMLSIYSQFICCYRNCIISMDKVFSMERSGFILITGEHLPITKTMRSQVYRRYADYQFPKLNGGI